MCQYIITFKITPFWALSCNITFRGSDGVYSSADLWQRDEVEMGPFMVVPHQSKL